MREKLLTLCSIEDFVPFLDLCLTEEQLDGIIVNCPNISTLHISLKVKYYYVSHNRQQKIMFPLKNIFKEITRTNIDEICKVLELCVLVQDINSVTPSFLQYVYEFYEKEQDVYIVLKLLNVIINIHCYFKLKLPYCFNENLVQTLLLETSNGHSKLLKNFFCKFLVRYVICVPDVKYILSFILSLRDLYIISCCFDIFMSHKGLISDKFWLMIIDNFNLSDYNKKLSLNILKQYVEYVGKYNKFNEELNIIKGTTQTNSQFIKSWNNYFLLVEMSQEKALHLVTPALKMISTVSVLHYSWLSCLYKFFLSHPQNSIVFSAAKNIIRTDIIHNRDFFKDILYCLLTACNRCEYSEGYFELFKEFRKISCALDDGEYCILLKESLKINWCPVPAWYFYANVVADAVQSINYSLIMSMLYNIKNVPHSFIRDSCYAIILNFLVKQNYFSALTLKEFIKLTADIKKCDEDLLLLFFQYAHNNIQLYNHNISLEISNIKHSITDEIDIVFQIISCSTEHLLLLENMFLSDQVTDDNVAKHLAFYLSKYRTKQFNVTDYLERELQKPICNDDLNILCNMADHLKLTNTNSNLLKRCKSILTNSAQYDEHNIALAFKIYSRNVDEDIESIVKLWNTRLLNGSKIQNSICKHYLNVYFLYLKENHNTTSNSQEIYNIVIVIFDTQNDDVWLEIYENLDTLLRHYNHRPAPEFIAKLFDELKNFGSSGNMIRAWTLLIKTILLNINTFVKYIKHLVVDKMSQFSFTNDAVASVFINELLSVTEIPDRLFINLIMDFIFYGGIIRKDKRCEYRACKNIDFVVNTTITNNPNYVHTNIRTAAINVVFRILNQSGPDTADFMGKLCLQRYRQYFQKRYFPDSEIHLSKLRSLQLLFVLLPYVSSAFKAVIIDFIIESLCLESHQSCVRQLMQWLLIMLLINDPGHITKIFEKVDNTEDIHISAITAFIPVLYHVGVKSDEKFIENLIEVLLKWTMGAHFKLRLYSQIVIMKLIEISEQKQFTKIVCKYDALYKAIKTVLEMTGSSVENTLQTDKAFLDQFNVDKHYDLHFIYIGIPQLNNVLETEWEYIDLQLISHSKFIPTTGTVIDLQNVTKKACAPTNNLQLDITVSNIQKKISPTHDLKRMAEDQVKRNSTELILVATLIESGANLGGFARTCEIYGVKEFVISDRKIIAEKEFKSLSMTSEHWVDIIEVKYNNLTNYLAKIKEDGYVVVGVEQTPESFKLHNYAFPKKCALVLGNEKEGIPPHIFPFLDACVEIPQFGLLRSLNVHVAGAIVVWEYVKQNMLL